MLVSTSGIQGRSFGLPFHMRWMKALAYVHVHMLERHHSVHTGISLTKQRTSSVRTFGNPGRSLLERTPVMISTGLRSVYGSARLNMVAKRTPNEYTSKADSNRLRRVRGLVGVNAKITS